jgi:uncharacterized spore protein YtfJ
MDMMVNDRTMQSQTQSAAATTSTLERLLARIGQTANVEAVFGQPIERGEYTVIPCAKVTVGLGLGGGSGSSPAANGDKNLAQGRAQGQGEGVGGGGSARGRPVAAIVISRAGVHIQPIIDVTRVVIMGSVTATVLTLAFSMLGERRRRGQALRAFAFGRMKPFGRGGAGLFFPYPTIKLPSLVQVRRALKG